MGNPDLNQNRCTSSRNTVVKSVSPRTSSESVPEATPRKLDPSRSDLPVFLDLELRFSRDVSWLEILLKNLNISQPNLSRLSMNQDNVEFTICYYLLNVFENSFNWLC